MGRKKFKLGDHLYVDFGIFFHHGIYVGRGKVIEYSTCEVCKVSLRRFSRGRRILVKSYRRCSSARRTIARAYRRLGEKKYSLWTNNCEHFATWCKTGRSRCKQLEHPERCILKFVHQRQGFKLVGRQAHRTLKILGQ
jgi:hypothetical protein